MFSSLRVLSKFTQQMGTNTYGNWTHRKRGRFHRKRWTDKVIRKPMKQIKKQPKKTNNYPIDKDKNNYPVDASKTNDWKNNTNHRDTFLL